MTKTLPKNNQVFLILKIFLYLHARKGGLAHPDSYRGG